MSKFTAARYAAMTDTQAVCYAAHFVQNVAVHVAIIHAACDAFFAQKDEPARTLEGEAIEDCSIITFGEDWEEARRVLQRELIAIKLLFDTKPATAAVFKTAVVAMVKTSALPPPLLAEVFGFGDDEPTEEEQTLNAYWSK